MIYRRLRGPLGKKSIAALKLIIQKGSGTMLKTQQVEQRERLSTMQTMKIDYDRRFDTLYVAVSSNLNSYGDDSSNGVVIMRDMDTDAVTGITILSFLKKYKSGCLPELPPDIGLSIESDILPNLPGITQ